jgi:hypothetical protein
MRWALVAVVSAAAVGCGDGRQPAADGQPGADAVTLTRDRLPEFVGHTDRFKGKLVRVEASVSRANRWPEGQTTRDHLGEEVRFSVTGDAALELVARLPESGDSLLAARPGELLIVTFECWDGRTDRGNVVTGLEHPR